MVFRLKDGTTITNLNSVSFKNDGIYRFQFSGCVNPAEDISRIQSKCTTENIETVVVGAEEGTDEVTEEVTYHFTEFLNDCQFRQSGSGCVLTCSFK